ncbi:N-acetyl sugar amidotransferase [Chloroflexota bacterium]
MVEKSALPLDDIKYCVQCCMPETQEGFTVDSDGLCLACRAVNEKRQIDWSARTSQLEEILDWAKKQASNNYDCVLPVSGGKDSTYQAHVLVKVYHMKPLLVTFNHNWFSKTGYYNLMNLLEKFNLDHIMFTPNRDLVNRLAKKSLYEIGDACWHCHSGCGAFPLQIAVKFNIPLIVYGESSAETTGRATFSKPIRYDRDYFDKMSAKKTASQMVCDYLSEKDLTMFQLPGQKEYEQANIHGIHLGEYVYWDRDRQTEFLKKEYGWRETDIEGNYKRDKSAECIMPGVHDFTCYLKRGYGRATTEASADIRNGNMTREKGFELANEYDPVRPDALDYYLKATGMTEEELYRTMEKHRMPQLKGKKLPVLPMSKKQSERLLPFPLQIIDEMKP